VEFVLLAIFLALTTPHFATATNRLSILLATSSLRPSLFRGKGNIGGTLLGVFVIGLINNGLSLKDV
jgi:ribose/xylose/arabinose/galactoside ABC-type transport system permease subunit